MIKFLFKLILCVLLALGASFGYLALRSGDPLYSLYEWISPARFKQYDSVIRSVSDEQHLDPMLVKAIVWRESRFDPQKYGNARERGLMQVSERAANEWAHENKIGNFRVEDLHQSDPLPFALAEYNAGASRAQRWAGGNGSAPISARDFLGNIDFPGTRKYIDQVIMRYQFYKHRGRM